MACLACENYILLHCFIGFYACFVALVFYFISGSNHQNRAQTSLFVAYIAHLKAEGSKKWNIMSQAIRTKPKEAHSTKISSSQDSSSSPEACTWDQKLSITFLKVRSSECSQTSSSFWSLVGCISRVQDICSTKSSEITRVERKWFSHSAQFLKFLILYLMVAQLVERALLGSSEIGGDNSFCDLFKYHSRFNHIYSFLLLLPGLLSHPILSIRVGTSLLQPRGGGTIMKPPLPIVLKAINREDEYGAGHMRFHPSFWVTFMYFS